MKSNWHKLASCITNDDVVSIDNYYIADDNDAYAILSKKQSKMASKSKSRLIIRNKAHGGESRQKNIIISILRWIGERVGSKDSPICKREVKQTKKEDIRTKKSSKRQVNNSFENRFHRLQFVSGLISQRKLHQQYACTYAKHEN